MNIIEAIQAAENGKFITNNFIKHRQDFLRYIKNGVFFQHTIIDNKVEYKYEVREFDMAEILSIGWEIVDNEIINKHFNK